MTIGASIEFPFDQVAAPDIEMRCAWTLDDFAHYLGTQSATNRYRSAHRGADPAPDLVASPNEKHLDGTNLRRSSLTSTKDLVDDGVGR